MLPCVHKATTHWQKCPTVHCVFSQHVYVYHQQSQNWIFTLLRLWKNKTKRTIFLKGRIAKMAKVHKSQKNDFWLFLIISDIFITKPSLEAIYNLCKHNLRSKYYVLSNKNWWCFIQNGQQNNASRGNQVWERCGP